MLFKTFTSVVLPSFQVQHKTAEDLQKAITDFIKLQPLTDDDGKTEVQVTVKNVDGKLVVEKAVTAPAPQPNAAVSEAVTEIAKALTAEFKAKNHLTGVDITTHDNIEDDPKAGFKSLGEFAQLIKTAQDCGRTGTAFNDNRISMLQKKSQAMNGDMLTKAPTSYGNVTTNADGGFLIPKEFSYKLYELAFGEDDLMKRCDSSLKIAGNNITLPFDQTTPWGGTGVQARWGNEGAQLTQDKPVLESEVLTLHKLSVYVPVTNELLNDSPIAVDSYISRKGGVALNYAVQDAIMNGTGINKPTGILASPALLTVARNTANTIKVGDIQKLYARIYAQWRGNAVWIINQTIEETLLNLPNMSSGTGFPLYVPKGVMGNEFPLMYGLPVLTSVVAPPIGLPGDITGACLDQYLVIQKTNGIESASSMHLFFDYDMTAFRFIFRMDGRPWQNKPITLPTWAGADGTGTGTTEGQVSGFVCLSV